MTEDNVEYKQVGNFFFDLLYFIWSKIDQLIYLFKCRDQAGPEF